MTSCDGRWRPMITRGGAGRGGVDRVGAGQIALALAAVGQRSAYRSVSVGLSLSPLPDLPRSTLAVDRIGRRW